jgi:hypothetical protein
MPGKYQYVYMIRTREFINTGEDIHKIGMTSEENPNNRLLSQLRGTGEINLCIQVADCRLVERKIIARFNKLFGAPFEGREMFHGDFNTKRREFLKIALENMETTSNELEVIEDDGGTVGERMKKDPIKDITRNIVIPNIIYNEPISIQQGESNNDAQQEDRDADIQKVLKSKYEKLNMAERYLFNLMSGNIVEPELNITYVPYAAMYDSFIKWYKKATLNNLARMRKCDFSLLLPGKDIIPRMTKSDKKTHKKYSALVIDKGVVLRYLMEKVDMINFNTIVL